MKTISGTYNSQVKILHALFTMLLLTSADLIATNKYIYTLTETSFMVMKIKHHSKILHFFHEIKFLWPLLLTVVFCFEAYPVSCHLN